MTVGVGAILLNRLNIFSTFFQGCSGLHGENVRDLPLCYMIGLTEPVLQSFLIARVET
jgi:SPX domain protein involved in polyphosphate accumulation